MGSLVIVIMFKEIEGILCFRIRMFRNEILFKNWI